MANNGDLEGCFVRNGYKLTSGRKYILRLFLESDRQWVTADQIVERASTDGKKIDFSTVYRNLELMTNLGILCKVDKGTGANCYALNSENGHHHHLVCKSCGKTRRIDFCPLAEIDRDSLKGFSIEGHTFEIFGYCKDCRDKN